MTTKINAEWDKGSSRYRIYDPDKPNKTIAYVYDLTSVIEWYINYIINYDTKGNFYYTIDNGSLRKWEEFNNE